MSETKAWAISALIGIVTAAVCGLTIGYTVGYNDGHICGKTEGRIEAHHDYAMMKIRNSVKTTK